MANGLRARSKARRHAAIEAAAMRLFAEQGYDDTTVAQVAAGADVSTRTVSLYFPSKLDLALSYANAASQRLTDAFGTRRADDSALDVIDRWLRNEAATEPETLALQRAMLAANPSLRGLRTPTIAHTHELTVVSLAQDLGRPPDDAIVKLVAGAISGVISVLLDLDPAPRRFEQSLDVAMRLMRSAVITAGHTSP